MARRAIRIGGQLHSGEVVDDYPDDNGVRRVDLELDRGPECQEISPAIQKLGVRYSRTEDCHCT
jgi:hypothetical protein